MARGLRRLANVLIEGGEDLLVAAEDGAAVEHERRDASLAGRALKTGPLGRVYGNLAGDEVQPELRQLLADACEYGHRSAWFETARRREQVSDHLTRRRRHWCRDTH
jgi:hypothetical protein